MQRLEATVNGHVQGVFFRASTRDRAQTLELVGWVANQEDGSVRVVAEGTEETLHELLQFLGDGPPQAQVTQVQPEWLAATGEFDQFVVRY
jgi:acylphosphatase